MGTGKQQAVRVVSTSGLTEKEIQAMISDAQSNQADDKRKKEVADLRNNADGLLYTTEKSLDEYSNVLNQDDIAEIRADMEALKKLLNTADPVVLKQAVQRLEGSAYRIADAIYAEQEKTAG